MASFTGMAKMYDNRTHKRCLTYLTDPLHNPLHTGVRLGPMEHLVVAPYKQTERLSSDQEIQAVCLPTASLLDLG